MRKKDKEAIDQLIFAIQTMTDTIERQTLVLRDGLFDIQERIANRGR